MENYKLLIDILLHKIKCTVLFFYFLSPSIRAVVKKSGGFKYGKFSAVIITVETLLSTASSQPRRMGRGTKPIN